MKTYLVCLFDKGFNSVISSLRESIVLSQLGREDARTNIPFHVTLAYFDEADTGLLKREIQRLNIAHSANLQQPFALESITYDKEKIIAHFSRSYWVNYSNQLYSQLKEKINFESSSAQFAANHAKIIRGVYEKNQEEVLGMAYQNMPKIMYPVTVALVDKNIDEVK